MFASPSRPSMAAPSPYTGPRFSGASGAAANEDDFFVTLTGVAEGREGFVVNSLASQTHCSAHPTVVRTSTNSIQLQFCSVEMAKLAATAGPEMFLHDGTSVSVHRGRLGRPSTWKALPKAHKARRTGGGAAAGKRVAASRVEATISRQPRSALPVVAMLCNWLFPSTREDLGGPEPLPKALLK